VKVDELRVLEEDELGTRLKTARRELYELRFKSAVGQLENSSQIAKVRHDIARIFTVLNERELGISALQEVPAVGEAPVSAPKKPRPKRKEFVDEEDEAAPVESGEEATEVVAEAQPVVKDKSKRGRRAKAETDAKAAKE
jgi:large subunit ribosomal protein L29